MRRFLASAALPFALLACTTTEPGLPPVAAAPAEPAPLSQLVDEVAIPYESFTLPNGLTVLVHTDRKSPVVGVTTYYRVGSKHEPRGRTGFAHLFEHLMFGGSDTLRASTLWDVEPDGRLKVRHGDSFLMFVEWAAGKPVTSQSIQPFGAATTRPRDVHYTDQAPLFIQHKLKPVHFWRADVLRNAVRRKVVTHRR